MISSLNTNLRSCLLLSTLCSTLAFESPLEAYEYLLSDGEVHQVIESLSGEKNLAVNGAGTLVLTQNNTYTGSTTVAEASTLYIGLNTSTSTGTTGTGTILNEGSVHFQRVYNTNNPLYISNQLSGSGDYVIHSGFIFFGSTNIEKLNNFTGQITFNSGFIRILNDAAFGNTSRIVLGGSVLMIDERTDSGAHKNLTIQANRIIELAPGSNGFRAEGGGTLTLDAQLTGAGALRLTNATGSVIVSNINNNYAAETRIGATSNGSGTSATLILGNSEVLPNQTVLQFNAGASSNTTNRATFDLNGHSETVAGLHTNGGTGLITNSQTGQRSTLTFGAANTTVRNYQGTITDGDGSIALIKIGTNTQTLNGINTYTGGLRIEGGFVRLTSDAALGSLSSTLVLAGGAIMNNSSALELHADRTIRLEGFGGLRSGWLHDMQIHSKITGVGDINLYNDGGAIVLHNTRNDYQGKTIIGNLGRGDTGSGSNPTLILGNHEVLPNNTLVYFDSGVVGVAEVPRTSRLDLNGHNETVAGLHSVSGTNQVTNAEEALSTLTIQSQAENPTSHFSGSISGNIALRFEGSGTQVLSGDNNYHGGTQIRSGQVFITTPTGNALGSGSISIEGSTTWFGGTGSIRLEETAHFTMTDAQLQIGSSHQNVTVDGLTLQSTGSDLSIHTNHSNADIQFHNTTLKFDIFSNLDNDFLELQAGGNLIFESSTVEIAAQDTSTWFDGVSWQLIEWQTSGSRNVFDLQLGTTQIGDFVFSQSITDQGYFITANQNVVPEPSRALLLLLSTSAVLLRRRRM